MLDTAFYKGKKVFITGHTGFKGTWMCQMLVMAGAQVTGYALEPPTTPSLYQLSGIDSRLHSVIGDVRDLVAMQQAMQACQPEIVIHMAAQPIVRESYNNPVYTYETNVMGTVNLLECVRQCASVRSVVNVTTDKVYRNREWQWGYRECEELNGFDPYSNSKSCSELVTSSYCHSFFAERELAVSTARAGNVIGGGDFAIDRIVPDCVRAVQKGEPILVRNPNSTRPYQHVLEPVAAYLELAQRQYADRQLAGSYNVGPDACDCITTGELVSMFCDIWNRKTGGHADWLVQQVDGPHEANFLKLDCSKIKAALHWRPRWHVQEALEKVVEWSAYYLAQKDVEACMRMQIQAFLQEDL